MGYCTDILEIGIFDGKKANGVDPSERAHLYEDTHRKQDKCPTL
jgi:hypothetical protein